MHQSSTRPSTTPTAGSARVPRVRHLAVEHEAHDAAAIGAMDLVTLERHCAVESDRFYRGQPHDTRYAYELFRRALVERCDAAWALVFQQYRMLVESWVRRSGAFASTGESSEYFVGAAFMRFWQAIGAERFAAFPTLASLLHYLQLCAGCVVIDSVRAQSWAQMLPEEAAREQVGAVGEADEEAISRVAREEFWHFVETLLNSEAERVVVFQSFVVGRRPAEIQGLRPDLFVTVGEVYNIKRNILGRLSRNQTLRELFEG